MTNRTPSGKGLVLSLVVLALTTYGTPEASAAKSPSLKCRGAVAGAVKSLVTAGLKALDSCHKKRDKSGSPADCNEIDAGPEVVSALARGRAKVGALCQPGDPVLANYPDGNVAGVTDKLFPAVLSVIEASGRELQGSPTFTGDKAALKQLRKCHGAIGKGRSATVGEIFKVSSTCQKKLDKNAPEFSSIAPQCIASPGGKSAKAIGKLGQLCSGIDGATVGSCASLPDCVASAATADGQLVARLAFGGPTQCGNGLKELGEDCDDGNTVDGDGCPATCKAGSCGNGVREGAEACDDGVTTGNEDACLNSCQVASCGDGFVQAGVEECDDAAPPEGAVCSGCELAAAVCGADGIVEATVELEYPVGLGLGALRTQLDYPSVLHFPGSADTTDMASLTDLSGVGILLANDDDAASAVMVNYLDFDTTNPPNLAPGAAYRAQLQGCPQGTPIRPRDFACVILEASQDGTTDDRDQVNCRVIATGASGTPQPTTSTTSTTSTSSSSSVSASTAATTSTTTSTIVSGLCGNGSTDAGETCDDSNTVNEDNCPSDCAVAACEATATPAAVLTVTLDNPQGTSFGVGTVFIDYPEGLVLIPGFGEDSQVQGAVTDRPATGAPNCVANDRGEHGLQFGCFSIPGFPDGQFFKVAFRDCGNAGPATLQNFTCTVIEAANPQGAEVPATCTLSLS